MAIIKQLKWSLLMLKIINTYIGTVKEANDIDPNFQFGDHSCHNIKIQKHFW